ncbi:hypothetical protein AU476_26745 [Cupriavidus sp. UYMSc13B]|nr:hypothetical protein AU476_26745 [Cupriavidus sp. UYMSc13B]
MDSAMTEARRQLSVNSGFARRQLSGAAALTEIFGKLQDLISKGNLDELTSNQKVFQEMRTRRQEQLQKKSEEYENQVKKAEQMQKTMGLMGKILGWIVIAVSVVTVPFTGGLSFALAAVGLALAVSDQLSQAITGVSFMGELLNPIMDAVLKPMMSFFAQVITSALESFGTDSSRAQMAGAIAGAVLASIVFVAAAFAALSVGKAATSRIAGVIAGQVNNLMSSLVVRKLIELVVSASEKSGLSALTKITSTALGRFGQAIGVETDEGLALGVNCMERVAAGLYLGRQAVQATGDITVGIEKRRAMNALAAVKEALVDLKIIGDALERTVETFAHHNRALTKMLQNMTNVLATETSTGTFILLNARAV